MHAYVVTHEADHRMAERHADAATHRRVRTAARHPPPFPGHGPAIAGILSRKAQAPCPGPSRRRSWSARP